MVQIATNFVNPGGTWNVFNVGGTLHDGTRMKNVQYYMSVAGNPKLFFINTNVLPVKLSLTQTGPDTAQLRWPSPPYHFVAQFSTTLGASNTWRDLPGGSTQSGTNAVANVGFTNSQIYFRAISR